jgi:hypothetical protein
LKSLHGIAILTAGAMLAFLGIFLESLLRLAYAHNALSQEWQSLSISVLLLLQWPGLVLKKLGVVLATDFTHSHILGGYFWSSLVNYFIVNSAGWSILILVLALVASKSKAWLFAKIHE